MNESITANGLTLHCLPSQAESLPERTFEDLSSADAFVTFIDEHFTSASYFVAYMDYRVIIGRYIGKKFDFYHRETGEQIAPNYLQKLRIFNQAEELLFWRSGKMLKGRYRKDGEGKNTPFVEAKQVLFGTRKGKNSNAEFTEITEDRGTSLILPTSIEMKFDKDGKLCSRVCLITRNYVGEIEATHQATYNDCRFVRFDLAMNNH